MKMKKLLVLVLLLAIMISCFTFPTFAAENNDNANILASCSHNFVFSSASSTRLKHNMICTKCGATMQEPCYTKSECYFYKDRETLKCYECDHWDVNIHNYEYQHNGSDSANNRVHIKTCVNESTYHGPCGKTSGTHASCSLEPKMVWRAWKAGSGHIVTQTCSICNYKYTIEYVKPVGHPDYFDVNNNCQYCKMGYPHYMPLA